MTNEDETKVIRAVEKPVVADIKPKKNFKQLIATFKQEVSPPKPQALKLTKTKLNNLKL